MAYQIGASFATLVTAESIFYVNPQSKYLPGAEKVRTVGGTNLWLGYARSMWTFKWLSLARYEKALAIAVSSLGTGTLTGLVNSTTIEGAGTTFVTELAVSDVIAAHRGSGLYEVLTVASITDADTFVAAAKPTVAFAGAAFRYRRKNIYSGVCYLTTRNDLDSWQSYSAVVNFPDPSALERSGTKYLDVAIEFILTAVVTS